MKKTYITTTLPYINAEPHIGFALEIVRADAWARLKRLEGQDIFFNTGTDEHGLKVFRRAQELGLDPQHYCDQLAKKWLAVKDLLNLSFDNFIRTTDQHHIMAAQELWRRAKEAGYIYKKSYKIKYCVGCELERTESELEDGCCPIHPKQKLEIIEEENYFFRFSAFQKKLLELYEKKSDFVVPVHRYNEIKKFVAAGLQDFSISRLKTKMPWGIAVPDDKEQVMYVWFDALVNYVSAIGWPDDLKKFESWWPAVQVAGKDNLRQQSAMWQAMLMSIGLEPSRQIFVNSFITVNGQKMSKSLGNVIAPDEMVKRFGVDGTRWLLLNLNTFGDDMDLTWPGMNEKYNADLANGLGNLVSRILTLAEKNPSGAAIKFQENADFGKKFTAAWSVYELAMNSFAFDQGAAVILDLITFCDRFVEQEKPWQLINTNLDRFERVIYNLLEGLRQIAWLICPLMPKTSQKTIAALGLKDKGTTGQYKLWGSIREYKIDKIRPLFPRIGGKR